MLITQFATILQKITLCKQSASTCIAATWMSQKKEIVLYKTSVSSRWSVGLRILSLFNMV